MIGEKIFEDLKNAIVELDDDKAVKGAEDSIAQGIDPLESIDKGLSPGIDRVYWDEFKFSTRVEIINQRGQKFEKFVEWPTGNPHNPLSMEQVEDKFRNQAAYSLRGEEIETAIQKIHDLENINDLTDLMSTLAGR